MHFDLKIPQEDDVWILRCARESQGRAEKYHMIVHGFRGLLEDRDCIW